MSRGYFITGIGTDVGKSVAAAVFTTAAKADYWKPIQSGRLPHTDREMVGKLVPGSTVIHPETYTLEQPLSPHEAAGLDGVEIDLNAVQLPVSERPVVVEGAGGIFVPLNDAHTMMDLMVRLRLPVVLVSRHYLGSINHTLLSIYALRSRGLEVDWLVFIGDNPATESIILKQAPVRRVFKLPETEAVDRAFIEREAGRLRQEMDSDLP